MEIIKISKRANDLYKIEFSDNTSLNFYDAVIIKYNLLANKNIDDVLLKEMISYNNELTAYYKAINYIKTKLRTKNEIKTKLEKLNYSSEIINKVIKKLELQGYLNDDFYIKCYINDQINLSLKGQKKIIYELNKLGFKNVELDISDDIWLDKIKKIIEKKIKSNHNLSKNFLIKKIKNDLITLGYPNYLIEQEINNIDYQDNKQIIEKEINKFMKKYQNKYSKEELKFKLKRYLYSKGFVIDNVDDLLNN